MASPQSQLCSWCNTGLPADSRFCQSCGQPAVAPPVVSSQCRGCGSALDHASRFCSQCGEPTALFSQLRNPYSQAAAQFHPFSFHGPPAPLLPMPFFNPLSFMQFSPQLYQAALSQMGPAAAPFLSADSSSPAHPHPHLSLVSQFPSTPQLPFTPTPLTPLTPQTPLTPSTPQPPQTPQLSFTPQPSALSPSLSHSSSPPSSSSSSPSSSPSPSSPSSSSSWQPIIPQPPVNDTAPLSTTLSATISATISAGPVAAPMPLPTIDSPLPSPVSPPFPDFNQSVDQYFSSSQDSSQSFSSQSFPSQSSSQSSLSVQSSPTKADGLNPRGAFGRGKDRSKLRSSRSSEVTVSETPPAAQLLPATTQPPNCEKRVFRDDGEQKKQKKRDREEKEKGREGEGEDDLPSPPRSPPADVISAFLSEPSPLPLPLPLPLPPSPPQNNGTRQATKAVDASLELPSKRQRRSANQLAPSPTPSITRVLRSTSRQSLSPTSKSSLSTPSPSSSSPSASSSISTRPRRGATQITSSQEKQRNPPSAATTTTRKSIPAQKTNQASATTASSAGQRGKRRAAQSSQVEKASLQDDPVGQQPSAPRPSTLYRHTILGTTLLDSLDELIEREKLSEAVARQILDRFDEIAVSQMLAYKSAELDAPIRINGAIVAQRMVDDVWTWLLQDVTVHLTARRKINLPRAKIVACKDPRPDMAIESTASRSS